MSEKLDKMNQIMTGLENELMKRKISQQDAEEEAAEAEDDDDYDYDDDDDDDDDE